MKDLLHLVIIFNISKNSNLRAIIISDKISLCKTEKKPTYLKKTQHDGSWVCGMIENEKGSSMC